MAVKIYSQEVPVNNQPALSNKKSSLNKTVKSHVEPVQRADGTADEIIAAFKNAGITVKLVKSGKVRTSLDVVYVMSGEGSTK